MSTDKEHVVPIAPFPALNYLYPQTVKTEPIRVATEQVKDSEIALTEERLAELLAAERAEGYAEADRDLRLEFERRAADQARRITERIREFEVMQRDYFQRVEVELVQLALSIAGKVLHREAQVDPMLLGAIVRLALGQLKEGSMVSIRVKPSEAPKWRTYLSIQSAGPTIKVEEDGDLQEGDCILETELGAVNLSLANQLKEIERGFFDVLAQKPRI